MNLITIVGGAVAREINGVFPVASILTLETTQCRYATERKHDTMLGSTASNFMEIGDVAQMTSCFKFTPVIGTNKGPKHMVVTTSSNTLQDIRHMVVDVVAMAVLFAFVFVSSFVLFFTVPRSWFGDVPRGCATTRDVYFGRGIDATLGQQWYGTGHHQSWQRFATVWNVQYKTLNSNFGSHYLVFLVDAGPIFQDLLPGQ